MSKILLINAHPNPAKSVANNAIIAEVTRRLPEISVHNIADSCRNGALLVLGAGASQTVV